MTRKLISLTASVVLLTMALSWSGVSLAASTNLFAVVGAAGSLRDGNGVTGVTHVGTGRYEVTFTSDVSGCAYLATTIKTGPQALQAYTAAGGLGPRGVAVEIENQAGELTDGRFNLAVICDTEGADFAVIGYEAEVVRASGSVLTLTALGGGRYQVWFDHDVSGCAYLATVGDPGTGQVANPAGVYTAGAVTSHGVYVETKNPGGGLQAGVPFHLGVVCPDAPDTHVAVTGADGIIARGSSLTSTFLQRTGQYTVVTGSAVNACATIATRGSVDGAAPFTPATVEIADGPAPNTTGVESRSLQFLGGAYSDQAFHAAVVC